MPEERMPLFISLKAVWARRHSHLKDLQSATKTHIPMISRVFQMTTPVPTAAAVTAALLAARLQSYFSHRERFWFESLGSFGSWFGSCFGSVRCPSLSGFPCAFHSL